MSLIGRDDDLRIGKFDRFVPGSLLADIVGPKEMVVNSRHNEAVNPNILGDGLTITAMSEDGVVEAIEMKEPWCEFILGVQFHPENLANNGNARCKKIFRRFVEAAAHHAGK